MPGRPGLLGERDQVATIVEESNLPYENLLHTLALGLLVLSKHDHAEERHGPGFSNAQLATADSFTSSDLARFREIANTMLAQFAVNFAAPPPVQPSLLDRVREWFWGFGQGYVAALAWSLTLLLVALLVRYSGGDLIDIFARWAKPAVD